jgi:RimJ/RimL family protein N-acetyltransferase
MSAAIRPIVLEDAESHRACLDAVAREKLWLAMTAAPPLDGVLAFIRPKIESGEPMLVAFDEDHVVGWCDLTASSWPTLKHIGVLGMGLLPDYRGRGLGETLLRRIVEAGWRYGFTRIELAVYVHNERARRLYERVGFAVEGVKRRSARIDGRYYDSTMMSLLAPDPA